jgi:hypothetical protein
VKSLVAAQHEAGATAAAGDCAGKHVVAAQHEAAAAGGSGTHTVHM